MTQAKLTKIVLQYLIWVGIPFALAVKIERYFWDNVSPEYKRAFEEKYKNLPENISEHTRDSLATRGGDLQLLLGKIFMENFAIKIALITSFSTSIWNETTGNTAKHLAKYGKYILTAPGKKFTRLYKRLRRVQPEPANQFDARHTEEIRELMLNDELTKLEKLEMLKFKIQDVLKNLTGSRRKQFILLVIATILFASGGDTTAFTWFMARLRALIGGTEDADIHKYLIEIYQEFNAPLPEDLVDALPEEILKKITDKCN
jgi:hypothetical protein